MEIKVYVLGELATNCYLVICRDSKEAIVIDPGGDPAPVLDELEREGLKLRYIINTHGHMDHIEGNQSLQEATGAPILIHKEDAGMLTSPAQNLSLFVGPELVSPPPGRLLADGDEISWGKQSLRVLHTPGHTPGSISLAGGGVVFSGDTLFARSVGRTDFPGGSMGKLLVGIREKLLALPPETRVLPGHGPETTIGVEREKNPFLQG
ncbi:MAG: MBL fold metallo-hydrolase [Bacillota bacterium]|nr:MBL fold metallo-hydrolase [Bacillota bacterium]